MRIMKACDRRKPGCGIDNEWDAAQIDFQIHRSDASQLHSITFITTESAMPAF